MEQTYRAELYELIVVDGNSSDRSVELVDELRKSQPQIRVLSNPAAIVPIAMNKGIRSARGEIIVRADAHTLYPATYIENCVKYLEETGADNVGGPVETIAANRSFSAQLVATVSSNRFGVKFALPDRRSARAMLIRSVRRISEGLFDRIGLFNETLVRNQDNELNARIVAQGGKIYQTPALSTQYFPPDTFAKLCRKLTGITNGTSSPCARLATHWEPGTCSRQFSAVLLLC